MERERFDTISVPEIEEHLQERLQQIIDNFTDFEHYDEKATRSISISIDFVPNKHNPELVDTLVGSTIKLPKRKAKLVPAVIKNKAILVERSQQDEPLFPNIVTMKGISNGVD